MQYVKLGALIQPEKDATNSKPWFRRAPVTHSFKFCRLISGSDPFICFQHINDLIREQK